MAAMESTLNQVYRAHLNYTDEDWVDLKEQLCAEMGFDEADKSVFSQVFGSHIEAMTALNAIFKKKGYPKDGGNPLNIVTEQAFALLDKLQLIKRNSGFFCSENRVAFEAKVRGLRDREIVEEGRHQIETITPLMPVAGWQEIQYLNYPKAGRLHLFNKVGDSLQLLIFKKTDRPSAEPLSYKKYEDGRSKKLVLTFSCEAGRWDWFVSEVSARGWQAEGGFFSWVLGWDGPSIVAEIEASSSRYRKRGAALHCLVTAARPGNSLVLATAAAAVEGRSGPKRTCVREGERPAP